MEYIVGVDGGGTKTVAVVTDTWLESIGIGISGPSNYHIVGLDFAKKQIKEAIASAIRSISAEVKEFVVACLGLSGVGRQSDRELILPVVSEIFNCRNIILKHDAEIALLGATGCQPGVVVIAGTGSIAFGMNYHGDTARSGGWGWLLGDEGGAYYIGHKALISACRSYDGRGEYTQLLPALLTHFRIKDLSELVRIIYSANEVQAISELAPLVVSLARQGDHIAIQILREAGEELAICASAVIRKLNMMDDEFTLAISGSVFNAGELILLPFKRMIHEVANGAKISVPLFPPVIGALLIALKELGETFYNNAQNKLKKSGWANRPDVGSFLQDEQSQLKGSEET